jgi:hypothetical protein
MTRPPFSSPRGARAPSTSPDLTQLAQSELELGSRFVAAAESNQGVGCVRGADLGM